MPGARGTDGEVDPRLQLIYDEAVRGITQQQALVENLSARAGSVIFATAFASSLLGAEALSDGVDVLDWLAMVLLLGLGILIVFLLWPYHNYRFRFDPNELLEQHVDTERPSTLDEMHRNLAVRIESDRSWNWRIIQRLRVGLQVALVLLVVEILAWLGSIANST